MNRSKCLRARIARVVSLAICALPAAGFVVLPAGEAAAQQAGYGQTLGTSTMERQLYDYGPGKSGTGSGSLLDSTNPLDLLNKLKRSTALDDATPPVPPSIRPSGTLTRRLRSLHRRGLRGN